MVFAAGGMDHSKTSTSTSHGNTQRGTAFTGAASHLQSWECRTHRRKCKVASVVLASWLHQLMSPKWCLMFMNKLTSAPLTGILVHDIYSEWSIHYCFDRWFWSWFSAVQCGGEVVTIKLVWSLELQFNLRPAVDCMMDPRTDYIAAKYARLRGFGPLQCPRAKFLDLAPYGPCLGSSTCSRIVISDFVLTFIHW